MFEPTYSTLFGRVRATEPTRITFPRDPVAALAYARRVDRQADFELQAGHHRAADRLSVLAYELRARATGARA